METKSPLTVKIQEECREIEEHLKHMARLEAEQGAVKETLGVLLTQMSEENDATLKYHGASATVRSCVDQKRYTPSHKELPIEERLDAIERDIAKINEELRHIIKHQTLSCISRNN